MQSPWGKDIPPYKDYPVALYLDESEESKEAVRLLEEAKIVPVICDGDTELLRRPLLEWGIGVHQRLESIKNWLNSEIPD